MKDLTQGSIPRHIIAMAVPMAVGMLVQTLYYLVDLYFVSALGDVALAGVSAAGNAMFLIIALTQMLGVATTALISHAAGRRDQQEANLLFNQSIAIAALFGVLTLLGGYWLADDYMAAIAADPATVQAGKSYLYWIVPGMALQFALISMGSALRGTGIVKPTMIVQMATVGVNILLAPVLIAGWGTGVAFGVPGAGLASSIAVAVGVLLLWLYFSRLEKYVAFDAGLWVPRLQIWKRMLAVGFPAGGEFILLFFIMAVIYWAIQGFGPSAQAGFGAGSRIMQSVFLPAMAIAFAAPAVAGQNFGAQSAERVRATFRWTVLMTVLVMALLTLLCRWRAGWLVEPFAHDPEVRATAVTFLHVISLNFVPSALIFSCSGMFQAVGNTWPAFISTATRLGTFVVPAVLLTGRADYQIKDIWYLSVATVALQSLVSLWLLRREFRRRLIFPETKPGHRPLGRLPGEQTSV